MTARSIRRWSFDEDTVLYEDYPNVAAIRIRLPHRTRDAIVARARLLELNSSNTRWTLEKVAILAMLRRHHSLTEIARIMHLSPLAINWARQRFGLPAFLQKRSTRKEDPLASDLRRCVKTMGLSYREAGRKVGRPQMLLGHSNTFSQIAGVELALKLNREIYVEWAKD